jgi:5-methylcytosine-specific restriction endonuclease McrA
MFLQQPEHRLCVMCLDEGGETNTVIATVADHVVPHKGNEQLFWFGELQGLCRRHHNVSKQQLETKGYTDDISPSGWPCDPNHPANTGKLPKKKGK